jgi:hypothetical protein
LVYCPSLYNENYIDSLELTRINPQISKFKLVGTE